MSKGKSRGHYCCVCGETKANERFSGKGHSKHICKACSKKRKKTSLENNSIIKDLITKPNKNMEQGRNHIDIDPDDLPF